MKLIIDRLKWHRGKYGTYSRLKTYDGRYCCLGFLSLACGLTDEQILNISDPKELKFQLKADYPKEMNFLLNDRNILMDSDIGNKLMQVNDEFSLNEAEDIGREQELTELFSTVGIEVEFIH